MSRNKRNRWANHAESGMTSQSSVDQEAKPTSWEGCSAESERDILLQLIPDQVFRIKVKGDGAVTVSDERTQIEIACDRRSDSSAPPRRENAGSDYSEDLGRRLALHSRELVDSFLETGLMQTLELQVQCGGRTTQYQVRAAACAPWEVLAVVTDVTAQRESEASIERALSEVARLNEILQSEAALHAEDEQIMDNAFAKLGKLLEDTIGAIQMIVKQKDPPTARHQARVCRLACAIGREMGLEKAQVDTIGLAALLHDLGKVFIPSDTLNKPGKLTEDEYAAVKNSAETEFQILGTIDLFYPIADIVHQHHERLNGSGYPMGLAGDDILKEARVIAVADVVEAMVSERPYRPAHSLEAALNEIESGKGVLYDSDAVEACIRMFRQGGFSLDQPQAESRQEPVHSGA